MAKEIKFFAPALRKRLLDGDIFLIGCSPVSICSCGNQKECDYISECSTGNYENCKYKDKQAVWFGKRNNDNERRGEVFVVFASDKQTKRFEEIADGETLDWCLIKSG